MTNKSKPFGEFLKKASYFVLLKLRCLSLNPIKHQTFSQHYSREDLV